ncbi:prepilin-type N-terminal cleavage/methylation domain-containing protein [Clostridium sp. DL1XJH146]
MKYSSKKGMTLLEVIISIAILGIIVTPMLSLSLTSNKINAKSEEDIQAMALAQKHFEYLKSKECVIDTNNKEYLDINDTYKKIDDGKKLFDYDTNNDGNNDFIIKEEVNSIVKYNVTVSNENNKSEIKNIINITIIAKSGNSLYYTINDVTTGWVSGNSLRINRSDSNNIEIFGNTVTISTGDILVKVDNSLNSNINIYPYSTQENILYYEYSGKINWHYSDSNYIKSYTEYNGGTSEEGLSDKSYLYKIDVEIYSADELDKPIYTFSGYKTN